MIDHHALWEAFLVGDFNAHSSNWYGEWVTEFDTVNCASRKAADKLVDRTEHQQYMLMNRIGIPTYFPRMTNLRPTICDLTFTWDHSFTITYTWSADPEGVGDWYQPRITTLLSIHAPEFVPRRQKLGNLQSNNEPASSRRLLVT